MKTPINSTYYIHLDNNIHTEYPYKCVVILALSYCKSKVFRIDHLNTFCILFLQNSSLSYCIFKTIRCNLLVYFYLTDVIILSFMLSLHRHIGSGIMMMNIFVLVCCVGLINGFTIQNQQLQNSVHAQQIPPQQFTANQFNQNIGTGSDQQLPVFSSDIGLTNQNLNHPDFNQHQSHFNQQQSHFNQQSSNFNQHQSNFNQQQSNFNQQPSNFDQHQSNLQAMHMQNQMPNGHLNQPAFSNQLIDYMNNNPEFTHQLQEQYGHNNNGHQQQQQHRMQMEPHFMSGHDDPYRYGGSQGHGQSQGYMSGNQERKPKSLYKAVKKWGCKYLYMKYGTNNILQELSFLVLTFLFA